MQTAITCLDWFWLFVATSAIACAGNPATIRGAIALLLLKRDRSYE
jgi:hypothetical protein